MYHSEPDKSGMMENDKNAMKEKLQDEKEAKAVSSQICKESRVF